MRSVTEGPAAAPGAETAFDEGGAESPQPGSAASAAAPPMTAALFRKRRREPDAAPAGLTEHLVFAMRVSSTFF
jgi:hypothetical protein